MPGPLMFREPCHPDATQTRASCHKLTLCVSLLPEFLVGAHAAVAIPRITRATNRGWPDDVAILGSAVAGLRALIRREGAKRLAALGGTERGLRPVPRRRARSREEVLDPIASLPRVPVIEHGEVLDFLGALPVDPRPAPRTRGCSLPYSIPSFLIR